MALGAVEYVFPGGQWGHISLTCFPFLTDDDEMEGDGVIDRMEYVPPLPAQPPQGQAWGQKEGQGPLGRSSRRWRRVRPTGWTLTVRTQTPTRPADEGSREEETCVTSDWFRRPSLLIP